MQTKTERSLQAFQAVHTSWANTADPSARTKPGRDKFLSKFEDQVDPERTLPENERARRAAHARKAYFAQLARRSAQVRRAKAHAKAGTP